MFAVIKTGGKQYHVASKDLLKIEKIEGKAGDIVEFHEVLMCGKGKEATIGAPFVKDAVVSAEIIEQMRGPKVIAFKKRRRQNSKRTRGHRQELTLIRIGEIHVSGKKAAKETEHKAKASESKAAEHEKKVSSVEAKAPKTEKAPKAKATKTTKAKTAAEAKSSRTAK